MYYKRAIEKVLTKLSKQTVCITLYGARQTGKSTVVKELFSNYDYVTLDNLDELRFAKNNPKEFLKNHKLPLIIDEIQRAPELLTEIKIVIDEYKYKNLKANKKNKLLFVLTGSNQTKLKKAAVESLAGRTLIVNMSSFSRTEIMKQDGNAFVPKIEILKKKEDKLINSVSRKQIFEDIYKGGMPEYIDKEGDRNKFFESYVSSYIEKDIMELIDASNIHQFKSFLEYVALRTAQQLNYSDISKSVGIDNRTCKKYLSILEFSGIIMLLRPYMSNKSKRIIKSPKLYFLDTGLCSYLCKWPSPSMLEKSAMAGAFFETYVVSEIYKSYINDGKDFSFYFYYYRDKDNKEIDLIYEEGDSIVPIEIKKGINADKPNKNFDVLLKFKKKVKTGLVIDTHDKIQPINEKAYYCPIDLIGR